MIKLLKATSLCLLAALALALAAGSVIEKVNGSFNYTSIAMMALWIAVAISSVSYMVACRLWRKPTVMLLHSALVVIVLGAAATWLTKTEGEMHLTLDCATGEFVTDAADVEHLPFNVELLQLQEVTYPATSTPSNVVCELAVNNGTGRRVHSLSINKPVSIDGYRFTLKGYAPAGDTATAIVSHDPLGSAITQFGYALLILSIIVYLALPRTLLRESLKRALVRGAAAVALLFPWLGAGAQIVPGDIANRFADIMVLYNGRICPMHTLAHDYALKVCGTTSPGNDVTCEQLLVSWMLNAEAWNNMAVVKTNRSLAQMGIGDGSRASVADFFDSYGNYKLADSALPTFDEKINLANSLAEGRLVKMFPCRGDEGIVWCGFGDDLPEGVSADEALFIRQSLSYLNSLITSGNNNEALRVIDKIIAYQHKTCGDALPSDAKVAAENLYNRASNIRLDAILCFLMAIAGVVLRLRQSTKRWATVVCRATAGIVALHLTLLLGLRWWVSGHVPLGNGFETMLFMAWCAFALAVVLRHSLIPSSVLALLVSGMCLMVASMSGMNPQITPLVPVLQSPLLCIHVAVVMFAYCLFALAMIVGATSLIARRCSPAFSAGSVQQLAYMNQAMIIVGALMLAAGIFVGAIWAEMSWGRYWGWDPKEVWALITFIVYSLPLHIRHLRAESNPAKLHVYAVAAFGAVIITYFGVNYLLGGLHAYA